MVFVHPRWLFGISSINSSFMYFQLVFTPHVVSQSRVFPHMSHYIQLASSINSDLPSHRIWYKKNWAHPELSNLNPSVSPCHLNMCQGQKSRLFFGGAMVIPTFNKSWDWMFIYIYRCIIITYKPLLWSSWPSPAIKSLDPRTVLSVFSLSFFPSVQAQFAGVNWRGKW